MLVRHFKNHSTTPQKYVRVKLQMFANGGGTQLDPLEIVGECAQLLATFARVERTPGFDVVVMCRTFAVSPGPKSAIELTIRTNNKTKVWNLWGGGWGSQ